jgi:hypothetical protein
MKRISAGMALMLAACASGPISGSVAGGDASALRGCWIERSGTTTTTQRWFPRDGGWRGDQISYVQQGDPDAVRWVLKPGGDAAPWSMCMVELNMMSSPPCQRAFFGPGKADGDNTQWVEIEAAPETLKISYVTGPDRAVTFDGRRDGCD